MEKVPKEKFFVETLCEAFYKLKDKQYGLKTVFHSEYFTTTAWPELDLISPPQQRGRELIRKGCQLKNKVNCQKNRLNRRSVPK